MQQTFTFKTFSTRHHTETDLSINPTPWLWRVEAYWHCNWNIMRRRMLTTRAAHIFSTSSPSVGRTHSCNIVANLPKIDTGCELHRKVMRCYSCRLQVGVLLFAPPRVQASLRLETFFAHIQDNKVHRPAHATPWPLVTLNVKNN